MVFLHIKSLPNLLFGVLCLPGDQSHPVCTTVINPLACCICWAGLLGRAVFPPWNEGLNFGSYTSKYTTAANTTTSSAVRGPRAGPLLLEAELKWREPYFWADGHMTLFILCPQLGTTLRLQAWPLASRHYVLENSIFLVLCVITQCYIKHCADAVSYRQVFIFYDIRLFLFHHEGPIF